MKLVDLRGKLPVHETKRYKTRKLTDIRSLGIHHSLTFSGTAEAFAGYHVGTNNWPGIGYAYVIERDGTVYWCWDWDVVSYHVGDSNKHALGICMVGDFRMQRPTPEQYAAALELVRYLQGEIPTATKVKGHSEYPGYSWKPCPVIDMDEFRMRVEEDGVEMLKRIAELENQVAELHEQAQEGPPPDWAIGTVNKLVKKELLADPNGTRSFHRTLVVLDRAGVFDK